MVTSVFRAQAFACALLTTTAIVPAALAQSSNIVPAPVRQFVDQNGVDLFSGSFIALIPSISIGDEEMGLSYQRWMRHVGGNALPNDSLLGYITIKDHQYTVTINNQSEVFNRTYYGEFFPVEYRGSTLTQNNGIYTYKTRDGTTAVFEAGDFSFEWGNAVGPVLSSITYPSGKRLNFYYTVDHLYDPQNYYETILSSGRRLQSVVSNTGYHIKFTYQSDTVYKYEDVARWQHVTKIAAYNAREVNCDTAESYCSATGNWPSVTIGPNSGTVQTYTDSEGRTTTFYSRQTGMGSLISHIRYPGSTTDDVAINRYNSGSNNGKVSSVTAGGVTTTYGYSDSGNERTVTVKRGSLPAQIYKFDIAKLQLTYVQDEAGLVTRHEYDTSARRTKTVYPGGDFDTWEYDDRGNVTKATRYDTTGSDATKIVTSASYPASCSAANSLYCNKPESTTDALNQVTTYTYHPGSGAVETVTLPAPAPGAVRPQTRYSYARFNVNGAADSAGIWRLTGTSVCQTTSSCAGTGDEVKTTIGYGRNLLPTTATVAAGDGSLSSTVTQSYDAVGNLLTVDGPLAGSADVTRYRYNAARELIGTVGPDPDGGGALKHRASRVTLDGRGLVSKVEAGTVNSQSDADWNNFAVLDTVEFGYDDYRRKIREALVTGGATQSVVQYSYDSLGRPDCTALRMNPAVFGSLPAGACIMGAQGSFGPDRISKTEYDPVGRVSKVLSAVGTAQPIADVTYGYTADGLVATLTDAENNTTTYEYDEFRRLKKTYYPNPIKGAGTSSTTDFEELVYDEVGRLKARLLRDGQVIGYGYDNLGRLTLKTPGSEQAVSLTYDLLGRTKTITQGGHTLTHNYDALGRLLSQTGPLGTVSYEYDAAGRRTKMTYPGSGLYINYDYLVTGEVTKIRENGATTGVGVLASYAYDDRGRRTSLARGNGTVTSYSFDDAQRLSQIVQNLAGTGHDLTLGFNYNPAGQITTTTRSNDAYAWRGAYNVSRGYTANGLNQYTASGPITPTYDKRGNLTQAGNTTYSYSSENLLISASGGITLGYDPLMRLYQTSNGSVTTRLAYDGEDLIAEYNGAGSLLRRYVHGPGVDEPIVWYEGTGTSDRRWLHADERGSIVAVTNSAGTVTAVNSYDEYGIPGATNQGRFQYTGQTWLSDLGLYYYKARIYSATLGRFLQTDPIGYGDGMNLYAYVGNDPVNRIDSLGLEGELPDINVTGRLYERRDPFKGTPLPEPFRLDPHDQGVPDPEEGKACQILREKAEEGKSDLPARVTDPKIWNDIGWLRAYSYHYQVNADQWEAVNNKPVKYVILLVNLIPQVRAATATVRGATAAATGAAAIEGEDYIQKQMEWNQNNVRQINERIDELRAGC